MFLKSLWDGLVWEELATKIGELSLIPRAHVEEGEKKLSSDSPRYTVAFPPQHATYK